VSTSVSLWGDYEVENDGSNVLNASCNVTGDLTATLIWDATDSRYEGSATAPGTAASGWQFNVSCNRTNYETFSRVDTFNTQAATPPHGGGGGGGSIIIGNETKIRLDADNLSLIASIGIPTSYRINITCLQCTTDIIFFVQCINNITCSWINIPARQVTVPKNKTVQISYDITLPSNTTIGENFTFMLTGNDAVDGLRYRVQAVPYLGGPVINLLTKEITFLKTADGDLSLPKWSILIILLIIAAGIYAGLRKTKHKFFLVLPIYLIMSILVLFAIPDGFILISL